MSTYRLEAVILKTRPLGEADRLISSFTRQRGRHRAVARGARRPRSSLGPCLQPYVLADLFCWRGRTLDGISQCKVKQGFRPLHESLAGMAAAAFLGEFIDLLIGEEAPQSAAFDLLVDGLTELSCLVTAHRGDPAVHWPAVGPLELLLLAFQWQLLAAMGFGPTFTHCAVCHRRPRGGKLPAQVHFSPAEGGLVCRPCRAAGKGGTKDLLVVSAAAIGLVELLTATPLNQVWQKGVPSAVGKDLARLSRIFRQWVLDQPLRSEAFLEQLAQP